MTSITPPLPRSLAGYQPVGSYKFVADTPFRQPVNFNAGHDMVLAYGPKAGKAEGYASLTEAGKAAMMISMGGKTDALGAFAVGDRFELRHLGAAKRDTMGRMQKFANGTRWDFHTKMGTTGIPALAPTGVLDRSLQLIVDGSFYWDARPGTGHTVDNYARVPMKGEPGHP